VRDLFGVNRSRDCDLLSVLSIYPRIFLCVFIVYRRIVRILSDEVLCYMLMCVGCFGLVVSICLTAHNGSTAPLSVLYGNDVQNLLLQ